MTSSREIKTLLWAYESFAIIVFLTIFSLFLLVIALLVSPAPPPHTHRRESCLALGFLAKLHPDVVREEVFPSLLQRLTSGEIPTTSCWHTDVS